MSTKPYEGNIKVLQDTPFGYTLSLISGKWKLVILYLLSEHQTVRYNELQRLIGGITYKTLSVQLRELEADDLIERKEYPQVPPKVEYRLSQRGHSLFPLMQEMCRWGLDQLGQSECCEEKDS